MRLIERITTCGCLVVAMLAGCKSCPTPVRGNSSGYFTLDNGTNAVLWCTFTFKNTVPRPDGLDNDTNTVFWCSLDYAVACKIQYIVLLPEIDESNGFGESSADHSYTRFNMRLVRNDHHYLVESSGNMNADMAVLRLSDLTAKSATNADLRLNRFWRILDEGALTPLDKVDLAIIDRVLKEQMIWVKANPFKQ